MPHHAECAEEELLAGRTRAPLGHQVVLVADGHAQRGTQRPQRHAQACANQFSRPLHSFMVASLNTSSPAALHETRLTSLSRIHRGKVRDVHAIDADSLLIVATDRLSAFDVILPDPIPGKGRILNAISNFWFARTRHIIPNHLIDRPLADVLPDPAERAQVEGRAVIARRLAALPIEAVVRGYLI